MSPRTGRPIVGEKKEIDVKVRFGKEQHEKLLAYCKDHNVTRTQAIRTAVDNLLEIK